MTILTDQGLQYLNDLNFGRESDPIDTMAVGIGDAPEAYTNTELTNELYRSSVDQPDVRFNRVPDIDASTYGAIDIIGGTENIPADSEITEIGAFVGAQDLLVYREVRAPVIAEAGIESTLQLRMDDRRGGPS